MSWIRQTMAAAIAIGVMPVAALLPETAMAQGIGNLSDIVIEPGLDRNDVAGMRREPDFSPQPLNAGPLVINARVAVATTYDTNVLNNANGTDDLGAQITPRIAVTSDTGRLRSQIDGTARLRRFVDLQTENSEEFQLSGSTAYQIDEGNSISARASYAQLIEPRSSIFTRLDAAEPVSFRDFSAGVGATVSLGDIRLSPTATYERLSFQDLELVSGGVDDQSFRDVRSINAGLTLGYALSPVLTVFAQGNLRDRQSISADAAADRSSEDMSVLGGVRGELSPLVTAEFAVGYRQRNFDNPLFRDNSGVTFRGDLQWFFSPLISFRLNASQDLRGGGERAVANIVSNRVAASAFYDIRRNLRLALTGTLEYNDFQDVDTNAVRPSLRLQSQYQLNPNLAFGAFVLAQKQSVSGTPLVGEFESLSVGLGVILTP